MIEWPMKNFSSHFQYENLQIIVNTEQQRQDQEEKQETKHEDSRGDDEARCNWDFSPSAVIFSSSASSDAIGVVEFDDGGSFLASGGTARKIRIYAVDKSLKAGEDGGRGVRVLDHADACEFYICTPAKLSSLKWRPGSGSRVIGSGDYDGVVMEYDLVKQVPVFERDEHGGRRVWSMDYSRWDPTLGAYGSDDGSMQMWDPRCERQTLASVRPNRTGTSPVCCVEFNPFGGPLVVAGCADRRVYGYDVRRMVDPVFVMDRHEKAVTYAKFIDPRTVISSSVDGCLMMWDAEDDDRPIRTYRGHVNSRRFVGLSVWRDGGLLSCGSENNRVYVYDRRWGKPVRVRGLEPSPQPRRESCFVSGVCWRQKAEERCMLVVGGSNGMLQVFEGERK